MADLNQPTGWMCQQICCLCLGLTWAKSSSCSWWDIIFELQGQRHWVQFIHKSSVICHYPYCIVFLVILVVHSRLSSSVHTTAPLLRLPVWALAAVERSNIWAVMYSSFKNRVCFIVPLYLIKEVNLIYFCTGSSDKQSVVGAVRCHRCNFRGECECNEQATWSQVPYLRTVHTAFNLLTFC